MRPSPEKEAHLVGIGFDATDGHKRITRAEKFSIVGGSEETHERMTETFVKTVEALKREGVSLEETPPEKLAELINENRPE